MFSCVLNVGVLFSRFTICLYFCVSRLYLIRAIVLVVADVDGLCCVVDSFCLVYVVLGVICFRFCGVYSAQLDSVCVYVCLDVHVHVRLRRSIVCNH